MKIDESDIMTLLVLLIYGHIGSQTPKTFSMKEELSAKFFSANLQCLRKSSFYDETLLRKYLMAESPHLCLQRNLHRRDL